MYQNAIQWQTKYQTAYWKNVAIRHERKYNDLLEKYQEAVGGMSKESKDEKLISESEGDSSDESTNEDYLKFMEISRRHQMERAIEKADSDDASD